MQKYKNQIILLVFGLLIMVVLIGGTLYVWNSETKAMEEQEQASMLLANEYLLSVTESDFNITQEEIENIMPEIDDLEYSDNQLFGAYTEENAMGTLDCVLEIPAIELRQSVFTGTPYQIQRNLARWMAVTGRSDYILGSTHYCIYMHNPTNKSIRISYAQETLVPGDYILLTKDNTVFFYAMTNMFPEWRQTCTKIYTDNMSLDSTWLYIFTCARREWQGRNLVIEGKLYNTYDLEDWKENSEKYIAEYKGQYSEKETIQKESLGLNITNEQDNLVVSVTRPDGTQALHCSVGIFNDDGYVIGEDYAYTGMPITLDLEPGEYLIGVYDNGTEYTAPMPYKVNLQKNTMSIQTVDKVEEKDENDGQIMKYVAIAVLSIFGLLYSAMAICTIRNIIKEKRSNAA